MRRTIIAATLGAALFALAGCGAEESVGVVQPATEAAPAIVEPAAAVEVEPASTSAPTLETTAEPTPEPVAPKIEEAESVTTPSTPKASTTTSTDDAATRAERAAQRAEKAAEDAATSAEKAERVAVSTPAPVATPNSPIPKPWTPPKCDNGSTRFAGEFNEERCEGGKWVSARGERHCKTGGQNPAVYAHGERWQMETSGARTSYVCQDGQAVAEKYERRNARGEWESYTPGSNTR